ncbi:DNA-3-methyladenine glycosylase I [Actinomyces minihominis]|uniref:DNA-3-methyladenine glycosylase I n=1 Tax=Actinomyces minihominis TaxID=2002838 RepID=UPI0013EB4490|nr:DNA-3-methyladenine glycosylase I [Actinomyces minihominis]
MAHRGRAILVRQGDTTEDGVLPDDSEIVIGPDGLGRPKWAVRSPSMQDFYDRVWGEPVSDDDGVFRMLSLLILQAGLFWGSILGRAEEMDLLLFHFSPHRIATLSEEDAESVLEAPGMLRNPRKLKAIIGNARAYLEMTTPPTHSPDGPMTGLAELVWSFQPETTPVPHAQSEVPLESAESVALAKALKARGFTFVGPRICYSLMQCIGVVDTNLVGTHRRGVTGLWSKDGARLYTSGPEETPEKGG